MGCVLSRRAAGEPPAAAENNHPRRRRGSSSLGRESVSPTSNPKIPRHSSNFSTSSELRRHVIDPYGGGPTTHHGWPTWLADVVGDVINRFSPRRASTFQKLDKIGQGTYSNVYKARDLVTGNIVALKKVRFDNLEPESVKFMAREILVLSRLDHPNVIKLQGLVTSRMSSSLYLVFDYMEHDLSGLSASLGPGNKFTEPQVKCFMKQLFSGLEHCHNNGVLHRDIKGSNLLIDNEGVLKIADFGLAAFYDPNQKQPMTSRVVTLWYRPPELLLGATSYGVGVDLWSAGCILAELLAGKPIMPGRTEVEQLHKIFKLCGSPSDEYWKKYKLPNATLFKPQQPYKRCVLETFKDFPPPSLPLLDSLLSVDPEGRGTATDALHSEYPPCKEMDVKLRDEAARRERGLSGKTSTADGAKKARMRDRAGRARMRFVTQANAKSKSEKFPPPHQDGAVGVPSDTCTSNNGPISFATTENSFDTSHFKPTLSKSRSVTPSAGPSRKKRTNKEPELASTWKFFHAWKPSAIGLSMDLMFKGKGSMTRVSSSRK
ncbi:hypothetical protein RDABS01_018709 [Bienertia sinuspersici]